MWKWAIIPTWLNNFTRKKILTTDSSHVKHFTYVGILLNVKLLEVGTYMKKNFCLTPMFNI